MDQIRWLLSMARPMIGDRPVSAISPQEALTVLRNVEANGRYESERRMRSVLSRVFRYAIATARAERDAASDLLGVLITPKVTHLAAIGNAKEADALMRAIDGYTGHGITAIALRLSPHVCVRPGEPRKGKGAEIDLDRAIWSLPPEEMKMRRPHRVPLSQQSVAILRKLRELTGDGKYLFPLMASCPTTGDKIALVRAM